MATFAKAIEFVLKHEDPHLSGILTVDSGGRTRFGIAEKSHPHLGDDFFLGDCEAALYTAKNIYFSEYWKPIHGYDIENDGVAAKILDMAVNMGIRQAVKLCQRACSAAGLELVEDGVIGPNTMGAINRAEPEKLLTSLRSVCADFYRAVAEAKPEEAKYLKGWLSRANA